MIDERARQELFTGLDDVLGRERAETLMAHLPPTGWADVATRQDLTRDISVLRQELTQEIAVLRQEIAALRQELVVLKAELRYELRAEINAAVTTQTRTIMFTLMGTVATLSGVMLTAIFKLG